MKKKEFATATLDQEYETFIVYVTSISSTLLDIQPSHKPQITDLITGKTFIKSPLSMLTLRMYFF